MIVISSRLFQFRYGAAALVLFVAVLFSSCTIERRHYRSGIYIDRNNGHAEFRGDVQSTEAVESSVQLTQADSAPSRCAIANSFIDDRSQRTVDTVRELSQAKVENFSTPKAVDPEKHFVDPGATAPDPKFDESDDLKLGLYALCSALAAFLLITFLFDLLPVIAPTLIAVAGLLAALFFLVLSIRWHVKRNRKRKEAGEATTHRELGRSILHALIVIATICLAAFSLLLAIFLTDW